MAVVRQRLGRCMSPHGGSGADAGAAAAAVPVPRTAARTRRCWSEEEQEEGVATGAGWDLETTTGWFVCHCHAWQDGQDGGCRPSL